MQRESKQQVENKRKESLIPAQPIVKEPRDCQERSLDTFTSWGRDVLRSESLAIQQAGENLDENFANAVKTILSREGKVVVTGLGKSGHIAAKIASTLSSTGTSAIFLHPSEALHGDFGMLSPKDTIVAIAYGGETREVLAVGKFAKELSVPIIAITGAVHSSLGKQADIVLNGQVEKEADSLDLAPTCSSSVALSLGDGLAVALMRAQKFNKEHFASLHPGGSLGGSLAQVGRLMHSKELFSSVSMESDFHKILASVTSPNFGIVPVVDALDKIIGSISDGDLRRILLKRGSEALSLKAQDFLNEKPKFVPPETRAIEAISIMEEHKITSLFVCSQDKTLLGIVRLHDLMSAKII